MNNYSLESLKISRNFAHSFRLFRLLSQEFVFQFIQLNCFLVAKAESLSAELNEKSPSQLAASNIKSFKWKIGFAVNLSCLSWSIHVQPHTRSTRSELNFLMTLINITFSSSPLPTSHFTLRSCFLASKCCSIDSIHDIHPKMNRKNLPDAKRRSKRQSRLRIHDK